MTREEAVSFGNMWLEMNEDAEESETYQFFKMAISALSAEGDLISREWLLKQPLDTSNYPSNYVKLAPSVENKEEPTDEEVIRYCNKRGYVIFTQDIIDYLKREQHGIRFEGYVGVNGSEFARLLECKGGE